MWFCMHESYHDKYIKKKQYCYIDFIHTDKVTQLDFMEEWKIPSPLVLLLRLSTWSWFALDAGMFKWFVFIYFFLHRNANKDELFIQLSDGETRDIYGDTTALTNRAAQQLCFQNTQLTNKLYWLETLVWAFTDSACLCVCAWLYVCSEKKQQKPSNTV